MCGMPGKPKNGRTHREYAIAHSCSQAHYRIHKVAAEEKDQNDCSCVNKKQSQVNSGYCLPKHRHDGGVGRISAWELHVVGKGVWGNTLQNEFTGISVFAFVALKWNSKESNSDGDNETKNNSSHQPPCDRQHSFLIAAFNHH